MDLARQYLLVLPSGGLGSIRAGKLIVRESQRSTPAMDCVRRSFQMIGVKSKHTLLFLKTCYNYLTKGSLTQ